jgi:glutamate mutase epsilon subunit
MGMVVITLLDEPNRNLAVRFDYGGRYDANIPSHGLAKVIERAMKQGKAMAKEAAKVGKVRVARKHK